MEATGNKRRHLPWRRRDRERGAALVESAIILPIVVLIVFGIIEYGMAFMNASTITASTRTGARTGSAAPKRPDFADAVANAVQADLGAMGNAQPVDLFIYKADPVTERPIGAATWDNSACDSASRCIRYGWEDGAWVRRAGTWTAVQQRACLANADSIGVFVRGRHDYITQLFGDSQEIKAHTIMRLEPLPARYCALDQEYEG